MLPSGQVVWESDSHKQKALFLDEKPIVYTGANINGHIVDSWSSAVVTKTGKLVYIIYYYPVIIIDRGLSEPSQGAALIVDGVTVAQTSQAMPGGGAIRSIDGVHLSYSYPESYVAGVTDYPSTGDFIIEDDRIVPGDEIDPRASHEVLKQEYGNYDWNIVNDVVDDDGKLYEKGLPPEINSPNAVQGGNRKINDRGDIFTDSFYLYDRRGVIRCIDVSSIKKIFGDRMQVLARGTAFNNAGQIAFVVDSMIGMGFVVGTPSGDQSSTTPQVKKFHDVLARNFIEQSAPGRPQE